MKRIIKVKSPFTLAGIWLWCLAGFFLILLCNCKNDEQKSITNNVDKTPVWFTAKHLNSGVWRISDHGYDNIHLVLGSEKALLIDTGIGAADLKGYVRTITGLPLLVVNTHGHADHAGGNYQFDKVYGWAMDFYLSNNYNTQYYHDNTIASILKESPELEPVLLKERGVVNTEIIPVREGFVFDLGNRKLQVIETRGHTGGSICLLDSVNRQLFVGDTNNEEEWLFTSVSLPLDVYLQTLEKLNARAAVFDTLFPGHGGRIDKSFISEQITCVQNILSGECAGEPFNTGHALFCTYKRAKIVFDPNRLHSPN
ncbi:MAG TPA: MBL fold metallo-hydrolase [bacterium]|nr:MBL fold metallo-hydrolase [bacterium]HPN45857.1 MBL fold metallo-hydrolase [bacterium]